MNNHITHLIECQCILSLFKNKSKPVYHKIPVFSLIDDSDNVIEKYVACDNCNIIHRVFEISKSEIKWGTEGLKSLIVSQEDIKFNLINQGHQSLVTLLEKENIHISKWELVEFILENNLEENLVLHKENADNNTVIKYIEFNNNKFKIKKEIIQRFL